MKSKQTCMKGVVQSKTSIKTSKTGNDFIKVFIRCEDHNLRCLMFTKEFCVWAATEVLVGDYITVNGNWNGEIMFVITAEKVGKGIEAKDKVIQNYGSFKGYQDALERGKKYHEANGEVQVEVKIDDQVKKVWHPETQSVYRGDKWQARMEYVCDKLGQDVVVQRLKEFCGGKFSFVMKKENQAKYLDFMDELIVEADFIEP